MANKTLVRILGDSLVGIACVKAGIPEALELYASLSDKLHNLQSDYGNFLAGLVRYSAPGAIAALTTLVTILAVKATDNYLKNT